MCSVRQGLGKSESGQRADVEASYGSDFNYDFHVSFDEDVAPLEYNYKDKAALEATCPTSGPGATRTG